MVKNEPGRTPDAELMRGSSGGFGVRNLGAPVSSGNQQSFAAEEREHSPAQAER